MSKLLENKQIIHIATEIVAMVGIVFYFSSKNKKLLVHIEDLSQRLEDQENLIQRHEQIIKQLVQTINNRVIPPTHQTQPVSVKNNNNQKSRLGKVKNNVKTNPVKTNPVKTNPVNTNPVKKSFGRPHVTFNDNEHVEEQYTTQPESDDGSSDDDKELDAEIADELEELQQQQDGLKKRT
jgi:hypothetical protein